MPSALKKETHPIPRACSSDAHTSSPWEKDGHHNHEGDAVPAGQLAHSRARISKGLWSSPVSRALGATAAVIGHVLIPGFTPQDPRRPAPPHPPRPMSSSRLGISTETVEEHTACSQALCEDQM